MNSRMKFYIVFLPYNKILSLMLILQVSHMIHCYTYLIEKIILNHFYYLIYLQFIDERIAALNSEAPIDDEFEKEIRINEMKSSKTSHLVGAHFGYMQIFSHLVSYCSLTASCCFDSKFKYLQNHPEMFQNAVISVRFLLILLLWLL